MLYVHGSRWPTTQCQDGVNIGLGGGKDQHVHTHKPLKESTKSSTLNSSLQLAHACGRLKVITASQHPNDTTREKSPRSIALSFVSTCISTTGQTSSRNSKIEEA
jgi:hypothetical protein